jgi:neuralized-like protein 4
LIFRLFSALRDALEDAGGGGSGQSTTSTVTRTNRYVFNEKHSDQVTISPDRRTASRQLPMLCFDQGIVFSDQPLHDNEVFEVRVDQMIPLWNGTLEIGQHGIFKCM